MFKRKVTPPVPEDVVIEIPCFDGSGLSKRNLQGEPAICLEVEEDKIESLQPGQLIDIEFLREKQNLYFSALVVRILHSSRLPVKKRRSIVNGSYFYTNTVPWKSLYEIEFTELKPTSALLKDLDQAHAILHRANLLTKE